MPVRGHGQWHVRSVGRGRWSGARVHHPWDARTRCGDAPRGFPRASSGFACGAVTARRSILPYASGVTPRPLRALLFALVLLTFVGCATAGPSFDPTGPCTTDGSAPGAYPGLEALVPTTYEGRGPDTLDSGRNCTAGNLGTLEAAGIDEVRFAGGTWDFGGDRAAALVVFQAPGLTAERIADFYASSAKASNRTVITSVGTPTLAGRPGHRLDTKTGDRLQTVVMWPSAKGDTVNVVITNDLPDPKIQAAVAAFGEG